MGSAGGCGPGDGPVERFYSGWTRLSCPRMIGIVADQVRGFEVYPIVLGARLFLTGSARICESSLISIDPGESPMDVQQIRQLKPMLTQFLTRFDDCFSRKDTIDFTARIVLRVRRTGNSERGEHSCDFNRVFHYILPLCFIHVVRFELLPDKTNNFTPLPAWRRFALSRGSLSALFPALPAAT